MFLNVPWEFIAFLGTERRKNQSHLIQSSRMGIWYRISVRLHIISNSSQRKVLKMTSCAANKIDSGNWSISIQCAPTPDNDQKNRVALHYVVDNSASMGRTTKEVQDIFSAMVDTVATAPCSMTIFHQDAEILSSKISTSKEMRDLHLPSQGSTNIPAGIEKALRVIYGQEMKAKAESQLGRTHHVLILLSDGAHNHGESPQQTFPKFRELLTEDVILSVVVVGYSRQSDTSMGMLLKKNIETVSFDAGTVKTVYFATSKTALRSTLVDLEDSLNSALKGSIHDIEAPNATLIENFHTGSTAVVKVHLPPGSSTTSLLCCANEPPNVLSVDGMDVPLSVKGEITSDELSRLIQNLINKTKVQIVAARQGTAIAKECAQKISCLVNVLETRYTDKQDLRLESLSPKERIKQCRAIRAACHGAKAFRNQVLDIANFSNQNSEVSAEFLNGQHSKFAKKALRRATKKAGGLVDPIFERKVMLSDLGSSKFVDELSAAMNLDALNNVVRLSNDQFENRLVNYVREKNCANVQLLREIRTKLTEKIVFESLSDSAKRLVTSGELSEYLNEVFHGKRSSYMSLSSVSQHIEEWKHFSDQRFDSTWEMLMYAGLVGYPIVLKRSSASQMNPFLLEVKGISTCLADSASMCCANQAEIPVYGPEGGEPVEDIMTIVDPSMPKSSGMICRNKLLGEKYTSAVIARDLFMFSGFKMKIALHGNTMFHLITTPEGVVNGDDVAANLRRTFMGRAFMCGSCGFGPVDHFACSDLISHHGEEMSDRRSVVNNACPKCGWFSSNLSDWDKWDGEVCDEFIASELKGSNKYGGSRHLSEAKVDLFLRIFYSFQNMSNASVKEEYLSLATKFATDDCPDISTKAEIHGMSQILLAILSSASNDNANSVIQSMNTETHLISIIQEACVRHFRKSFRMKGDGDKGKAKNIGIEFLTSLLGVDKESAPCTQPQMVSEFPTENVRQECDASFHLNSTIAQKIIRSVQTVAKQWCRIWSFAQGFSTVINSREGGWNKIERDMEVGCMNYEDVTSGLRKIKFQSPRQVLHLDSAEIQSLFLKIGVSAIAIDVLGMSFSRSDGILDSDDILNTVAREIRMLIYFDRVKLKMEDWKICGEDRVYFESKAADIAQYQDMINMETHVHGFDRPTFWGLWNAAKNTKNSEKVAMFLSTACQSFRDKHYVKEQIT